MPTAVERRGLAEQLVAAGVTRNQSTPHCDEMRFGLWGQVRRRWGRKEMKIVQKVQIEFAWQYLVLAVDVLHNRLHWQWAAGMNQAHLVPIFSQWQPDTVVWDGASAHRGHRMAALGFARIALPPYSPELNPEGHVWIDLKNNGIGRMAISGDDRVGADEADPRTHRRPGGVPHPLLVAG